MKSALLMTGLTLVITCSMVACGSQSDDATSPDSGGGSATDGGTALGDGGNADASHDDGSVIDGSLRDGSLGADAGADTGGVCPAGVLTVSLAGVTGSNAGKLDEFAGSCGPIGTADQAYIFVAPSAGNFVFQADDAAVYVLASTCGGAELGCSQSSATAPAAVQIALTKGESVTVVVDDTNGAFTLDALDVSCPRAHAASSVPQKIEVPLDYGNDFQTSCSTATSGVDSEISFTAPAAGKYVFDTQNWPDAQGPRPYVGLTMRDGGCSGPEIACADPASGSPAIIQDLASGQAVTMVLDVLDDATKQGTGTLNIDAVLPPTCPRATLSGALPITVETQTFNATDNFTDCTYYGSGFPDVDYVFTAPSDGTYTFDTSGSTTNTMIGFRNGTCSGGSLGCFGDATSSKAQATLGMTAGQTVTVVVESGSAGHVQLTVDELAGLCPNATLTGSLPIMVSGTTVGADNSVAACGDVAGPDQVYSFTTPMEGFYYFSADGTARSPNVSLRSGACTGPELTCAGPPNDADPAIAEASLAAGQTVDVVVDSTGAATPYDLTVSRFACNSANASLPHDWPLTTGVTGLVAGCGFYGSGGYDDGASLFDFQAPATGRYLFESNSVGLVALAGNCGGTPGACSATAYNIHYIYTLPRQTVALTSGSYVTLAATNPFSHGGTLHAERLTDSCPDGAITGALPAAPSSLDYGDNDLVGSCAYTGLAPDATYSFTAPSAGTYHFAGNGVGGGSYSAIYVLNGSCSGSELGCKTDDNYYPFPVQLDVALTANQVVVVAAEGMASLGVSKLP